MRETRERSSNFATPAGVAFLLAALTASVYFDVRQLAVLLAAALLIAAAALVWAKFSLRGLSISFRGRSFRGFPGEELTIPVTVSNDKPLPLLWLGVSLPLPAREFLAAEGGIERQYTLVGPRQSVTGTFRRKAVRRGVARLDEAVFRSGDGFGLAVEEKRAVIPEAPLFVVYPEIFPVDISAFMRDTADVSRGGKGYREDVTLLRGTRSYQPGDSFRRINWRVLAKQGVMSVNLYESEMPRRATFLLDLFSFTRYETENTREGERSVLKEFMEDDMEDMISLAASCISKLAERQIGCSIAFPRTGKASARIVRGDAGEGMAAELLTALASIEYAGELSWLPDQEILRRGRWLGQVFVFCCSEDAVSCRPLLEKLDESRVTLVVRQRSGGGSLWRVMDYETLRRNS